MNHASKRETYVLICLVTSHGPQTYATLKCFFLNALLVGLSYRNWYDMIGRPSKKCLHPDRTESPFGMLFMSIDVQLRKVNNLEIHPK